MMLFKLCSIERFIRIKLQCFLCWRKRWDMHNMSLLILWYCSYVCLLIKKNLITMCQNQVFSCYNCYSVPSIKSESKPVQYFLCLSSLPADTDIATVKTSLTEMLHVVDQSYQTWRQIIDGWCTWSSNMDGLVQDCSIPSALAMEILQLCTKLSIYQRGSGEVWI